MTRINVVPVEELTREHLVAEYRELPRIFGCVRAAIERGERPDDPRNPTKYCLGKGHMRFFYDKLRFLYFRHAELVGEMQRRGYKPVFGEPPLIGVTGGPEFDVWWNDYNPTPEALALNRERINARLSSRKNARSAT